jgi:cystathionine beta-lyase/cystathionine gamma-synthase
MTNPLLQVADHRAVAAFAREHRLVSLIDNTFATPVNFRPLEHGFDVALHSGTKYLNGHADLVAGALVGSRDLVERVRHKLNQFGAGLDPHACFLLHRGLKTLSVRMRQHNETALALARFLDGHPAVERVAYPGLASHPDHRRARDLFAGYGGVLSFVLAGGAAAAEAFIGRTTIPIHAVSLGGPATLLTRPAATTHVALTEGERRAAGIVPGLVRVAVGLESAEDLIEDFAAALGP